MSLPLDGRTVLVTRPRQQAEELASKLAARGAEAIVAPTVEIVPAPVRALEAAVRGIRRGDFGWIVLSSRSGVDAFFDRLRGADRLALPPVAAVGEGTAAALRDRGVEPRLVPKTFTTEALGRAMPRGSGRVLLARADIAPDGLEDALAAKGWTPVRVDAYRTKLARELPAEAVRRLRSGEVDAVTFTSASTVHGFVEATRSVFDATPPPRMPKAVCIGPVTSRACRDAGIRPAAVASTHTIDGLVDAVERALRPR